MLTCRVLHDRGVLSVRIGRSAPPMIFIDEKVHSFPKLGSMLPT
jgi:hypothetical protein